MLKKGGERERTVKPREQIFFFFSSREGRGDGRPSDHSLLPGGPRKN